MVKFQPKTKEELKELVDNLEINLDDIDTSLITDMSYLFNSTDRKDFSGIEAWDVSNVTNMSGMFEKAKAFSQPLEKWDVSKVTSMSRMFAEAESFNQPLNNWDVSNVTNMCGMFRNATSFNQPLDSWDISNVDCMDDMFEGAKAYTYGELEN